MEAGMSAERKHHKCSLRGRFFFIKSHLSGHVITVKLKNTAGSPLILWPNKGQTNPAQLFFEDFDTGTIRSMINDWCIEEKGISDLTVAPYAQGNEHQQWFINERKIQNRNNLTRVVDVLNRDRKVGAKVGVWLHHGGKNQHWTIEPAPPQYFTLHQRHLKKRMRIGNKIEEDGEEKKVAYELTFCEEDLPFNNQDLWYQDEYGVLRSKVDSLALDGSGGATNRMNACPYSAAIYQQQWVHRDGLLYNRHVPRLTLTVQQFSHAIKDTKTALGTKTASNGLGTKYSDIGVFGRENKGSAVQLWDLRYKLPRDIRSVEQR